VRLYASSATRFLMSLSLTTGSIMAARLCPFSRFTSHGELTQFPCRPPPVGWVSQPVSNGQSTEHLRGDSWGGYPGGTPASPLVNQWIDENLSGGQLDPLRWRPAYLRRRIFVTFLCIFCSSCYRGGSPLCPFQCERRFGNGRCWEAISVEIRTHGHSHHVAAFWGHVEYQSKLATPWIRLS
jgi:hypothetical protein